MFDLHLSITNSSEFAAKNTKGIKQSIALVVVTAFSFRFTDKFLRFFFYTTI